MTGPGGMIYPPQPALTGYLNLYSQLTKDNRAPNRRHKAFMRHRLACTFFGYFATPAEIAYGAPRRVNGACDMQRSPPESGAGRGEERTLAGSEG